MLAVNPYIFTRYSETFSGGDAAAGTNHVVPLPAEVGVGDRIIIAKANREDDQTWPDGWSELSDAGNDGQACISVGYRDCDGTEGGTTINVTTGSVRGNAWVGIKLVAGSFHAATAPQVGTTATADNDDPDPPSISPAWGAAAPSLILGVFGGEDNPGETITTYPTNYDLYQKYGVGTIVGANGYCGMAGRIVTATSEDPGAYLISASDRWAAQTIAVRLV